MPVQPQEIPVVFKPFAAIKDTRSKLGRRHLLLDVLIIAICAVVAGAEDCEDIADFGRGNEKWFRSLLALPHGIPAHDTFLRIFARMNPEELRAAFVLWVQSLKISARGKQVAIDGKTLRRSFDRAANKVGIHMVSAWCREAGMVLGQLKTDAKSNEITAVPKLLRLLDIRGATITGDAMNCQRNIAKAVTRGEADYILQVKDNQPTMRQEIADYFAFAGESLAKNPQTYVHTIEKGHGRIEERTYLHSGDIEWFADLSRWSGLRGFGMMRSRRTVVNAEPALTTTEDHYYITSFADDAARFATNSRGHWSIETQLHWRLDVIFNEDQSRFRKGHTAENFAVTRHIALNMLQRVQTTTTSIKRRRKRCGWEFGFLLQVLGFDAPA